MNPENILAELEEIIAKSEAEGVKADNKYSAIITKLSDVVGVIGEQSVENHASYERIANILSKLPEQIKQKAIKVTNFPKDFKVTNLKDIKFPKSVKVDKPAWLEELKNGDTKAVLKVLKELKAQGVRVIIDNKLADEALPVRLSDGQSFYKAIQSAISSGIIPFVDANGKRKSPLVDTQGRLVTTSSPTVDTGIEGAPVAVGVAAVEMTFTGVTEVIAILSDHDNTGKIWFGPSTVDNTGANAYGRLAAGQSVSIPYSDSVTAIYAVSDVAAQKVYKMAVT